MPAAVAGTTAHTSARTPGCVPWSPDSRAHRAHRLALAEVCPLIPANAKEYASAGARAVLAAGADLPGAGTNASNVHVAMDAGGDAVAVWQTDAGLIQACS